MWLVCAERSFSGVENNGLRWQFDYNFDYVICCGIKASDKLRGASEENVFFSFGGGKTTQKCRRWDFRFKVFHLKVVNEFLNVTVKLLNIIVEFLNGII